ncbi:hypothetical protein [Scytonema sp. NUACC26]|uniref:hypothetical protein n=1 Tax=Scytonema sp. NUACC26 TaxID=3140176 RepID=UPI0034DBD6E0
MQLTNQQAATILVALQYFNSNYDREDKERILPGYQILDDMEIDVLCRALSKQLNIDTSRLC